MRWTIAALALAASVASAQAQQTQMTNAANVGQHASANNDRANALNDANKVKANEKAYNAALKNLPDKQYDPWHGVR
jgi:hypothetical protein